MTKIICSLLIFCSISFQLLAQQVEQPVLTVESRTMVSTGDQVPFWLQMNQLGIYDDADPFQQLFLLNFKGGPQTDFEDHFQLSYGLNIVGRLSDHATFRPNEYWARLHYKNWYIHLGSKSEPVFANGLSLTNGNMFLSNNARPLPRVGFGVNNFKIAKEGWFNHFSFDFDYNEYFLLDDRYVDDAHLHHKRLDINYAFASHWTVSAGFDHWVFWGGTVPATGNRDAFEMPGFEDYFRYITGRVGSSDAPETDQLNVAGNQLGLYLASLEYENEDNYLKLYWQHLWEDRSGMQFENAPDGLWGIYWQQKRPHQLLESVVLEYANTRDQSGPHHKFHPDPDRPDYETGEGEDNYFTHGTYKSGFVSYNRMMGIPLFIPVIEDGISKGFNNTRFWAIHNGMDGWISKTVSWKTLLTYSKHYGRYGSEYIAPKEFVSAAVQIGYMLPTIPMQCALKLAYDDGDILQSNFGAELQFTYTLK